MNTRRTYRILGLVCLLTLTPARAMWSDDPAVNLAVADGAGEQILPIIANAQTGDVYVGWFDNSAGSYRVRLQRLSASGDELWPHNGILVSANPQDTALFGWDMIADSAGNAVLVFSDTRDGGDLDIHAYKIDPDGVFLWGANGITLSSNSDFEPAPRVAEASDGDFVFVWLRDPSTGDGDIRMQRLAPDGTPRLAAGGLPVVVSAGEDPGFVEIARSTGGDVILSWLRSIRTFTSPRHVRARKFSATGAGVWPAPVSVYDAFSVPIGYAPKITADGAGGAWILWHRSDGTWFNSFVQHLDSAGNPLAPAGGVAVSTVATMHHLDPALALAPSTGEAIVFWNERNSNQSQWGILGQKFSSTGARLWGDGGLTYLPVSTSYKSFPRAVGHADGAIAVLADAPAGSDRIVAIRVDGNGNSVWGVSPVVVSSAPGSKSRYPVTADAAGNPRVAWEDGRNGTPDVYAQNLNGDGTLGLPSLPGTVGSSLKVNPSSVTPGDLVLEWGPSCSPGAVNYAIYEGTIGDFTSHTLRDCDDGGADRIESVTPGAGDRYYLVVPLGPVAEGSYGVASGSVERPRGLSTCVASQVLGECPP